MNIRTIWSSKFKNHLDSDFFNEIEWDKLDKIIGFKLLTDPVSLEQWRQKMYALNNNE